MKNPISSEQSPTKSGETSVTRNTNQDPKGGCIPSEQSLIRSPTETQIEGPKNDPIDPISQPTKENKAKSGEKRAEFSTARAAVQSISIKIACSSSIILSAWYAGCMDREGAIFLTSIAFLGCLYLIFTRDARAPDIRAADIGGQIITTLDFSSGSRVLHVNGSGKWLGFCVFIILSVLILAVSQHKVPGFFNICLLSNIQISAQSLPYTMWLNWDKNLMAAILWLVCTQWQIKWQRQRHIQSCIQTSVQTKAPITVQSTAPSAAMATCSDAKDPTFVGLCTPTCALTLARTALQRCIKIPLLLPLVCFLVCIALVSGMGLATGYIEWAIKWPTIMPLWCINMLAVCFSEEVFYRGFFQHGIQQFLPKKVCNYSGHILFSSAFFALDHGLKGGLVYGFLSGLTGFFYGFLFENKQSILYSMVFHFLFNLVHILLFTYPASISCIRG